MHRADPNIAYVCLDAPDQDTHHLAPTGDYRCAERTELHALPWCDRLDAAIYDFAATLNLKNEPVWFPFTINHRVLTSPAGALDSPEHWLEPDVWLDVAQILAASPATSVLEHRS